MRAPDPTLPVIAGLWTLPRLSWLEQLAIASALDAGHRYCLYSYAPVVGVPEGAETRPAGTILAPVEGLDDRRRAVFHADAFRLQLLQKTRFLWADLDVVVTQPLRPQNGYLFGYIKGNRVGNSVLALPPESATLHDMIGFVGSANPIPPWTKGARRRAFDARIAAGETWDITALPWGMAGPKALTYYLSQNAEIGHAAPEATLYPVGQGTMQRLLDPAAANSITQPITRAVHVFGYIRGLIAERYNGLPPRGSWLDHACQTHGIDPTHSPIER